MKKSILLLVGLVFLLLVSACANSNGRSSVGVYGHVGFGPWWGHSTYYRDRVIVVPPDPGEGPTPELPIEPPVAEQLPIEPPVDFPDMGMSEVDVAPFD